jgi:putative PIN family toxin of toxin-antitoxin system
MEAARQRDQVQLFTSTVLLEELAEVLFRPFSIKRLAILGITTRQVLTDYVDAVDLVDPLVVPVVIADDPDDDHVIAAAVAAQADLIVSGDKHLLRLASHAGLASSHPPKPL